MGVLNSGGGDICRGLKGVVSVFHPGVVVIGGKLSRGS